MLKRIVRMFVRDELLSAVPPGKVLVSGTLWTGSLKPLLDAGAATFGPSLETPFAAGRTLHAEELAGVIDLGRAWVGDLVSRIRAAASDASATADPRVDLGPVLSEAERLDVLLRSAAPGSGAIADGLARLRRAADRAGGNARTRDAVNPLARLARITPEHRALGDRLNQQARDFWARESAPVTSRAIGDNGTAGTTAVRDQLAIAARAKDMRTKMTALNAAARAFWARA